MKTYYAATTIWLQTGKPASRNKDTLKRGSHLEDTFCSLERGQLIPADALTLLDQGDIADMLAKGQISETPPEPLIVDPDWQDIPAPQYPDGTSAAT